MTTKEKVIELAKHAGYQHPDAVGDSEDFAYFDLERFATLVRDQYRAELLAGEGEPAYTARPYSSVPGAKVTYPVNYYTADQLATAVLKARNAALDDVIEKCTGGPRANWRPSSIFRYYYPSANGDWVDLRELKTIITSLKEPTP